MKLGWADLQLFDVDNDDLGNNRYDERIRALRLYRRTGEMNGYFFHPVGLPHEKADDASTWGPESPDRVDWTGFPE